MGIFDTITASAEAVIEAAAGRFNVATTPKVTLAASTDGAEHVVLPYAPGGLTVSGPVAEFVEIARPGRKNLLVGGGGESLAVASLDVRFVDPDPRKSVDSAIDALRLLAASGAKVVIAVGPLLSSSKGGNKTGAWRITALSVTTDDDAAVSFVPGSLRTARATVSITLTEDSTASTSIGPATGGYNNTTGKVNGFTGPQPGLSPSDIRRGGIASSVGIPGALGSNPATAPYRPDIAASQQAIARNNFSLAGIAARMGITVAQVADSNGITRVDKPPANVWLPGPGTLPTKPSKSIKVG